MDTYPGNPLYFIDAEFIEDGCRRTIDLISIGIVSEDGREYYACNDECDLSKANDWVKANVIPALPSKHIGINPSDPDVSPSVRQDILSWKMRDAIAQDILEFCNPVKYGSPIFWGEWPAYDWVVFCWVFGSMIDLPKEFPMRCRDVIQWAEDHLGIDCSELPPSLEINGNHNALLGAKSVHRRWVHCWEVEQKREVRQDSLYSCVMEKLIRVEHLLNGEFIEVALTEISAIKSDLQKLVNG